MKKSKVVSSVFILAVLAVVNLSGCVEIATIKGNGDIEKVTKDFSEFTSIEISGAFNVFLFHDTVQKVFVETDKNLIDIVAVDVRKHKLKIETTTSYISQHGINVYIHFTSLKKIMANGAVVMKSMNKLAFDDWQVELNGASWLEAEINCVTCTATCNGSTTLKLSGAAVDAEIKANGAADIRNENLVVENLDIQTNGAVKARVNALNTLHAAAAGSSRIDYTGDPEVRKELNGNASIHKIF